MIANASRPAVFVDLSPLADDGSNGGAARFVLSLLERLAPFLPLHLLLKRHAVGAASRVEAAGATVHVLGDGIVEPRRLRRAFRRSPLASSAPDRASLRRQGATSLFSPLQTASFHEAGLRHVAIAYDFQELAHPAFFTASERRRRGAFRADLRRCDRVVAISRFTGTEAVSRAGIAPERISVLPPVISLRARLADERAAPMLAARGLTPGGYAFYPANFWSHKNHAGLLEALAIAREVRLVCCGALGEARARAEARARELGVADRVTLLPPLPDAEITALLQSARFLAFPSLFEGFGIPVLEAFELGTAVACSRLPALEELAGDAARLFAPDSPADVACALSELWEDGPLRARLASAGRARAEAFDPEAILARWRELLAE